MHTKILSEKFPIAWLPLEFHVLNFSSIISSKNKYTISFPPFLSYKVMIA